MNGFYKYFNYGSLVLVLIILVLMLTKAVPSGWFVYLLGFAIVIFIVRLIFRIYLIMQSRKIKKE